MFEYGTIKTVDGGFEVDGVLVGPGDPRHAQIVAKIAEDDRAALDVRNSLWLLSNSDWYVLRFVETGEPVPPEVSAARAAARERISRAGGAVMANSNGGPPE